jgi:hypothetical protein
MLASTLKYNNQSLLDRTTQEQWVIKILNKGAFNITAAEPRSALVPEILAE